MKARTQRIIAAVAGLVAVVIVGGAIAVVMIGEQLLSSDDIAIPLHLDRWLQAQRKGDNGFEFWDEFARMSVSGPNLPPYAQESVASMRRRAEKDRSRGRPTEERATVIEPWAMSGVEKWTITEVRAGTLSSKERTFFEREAQAECSLDVTFNEDGQSVTNAVQVSLYKNKGQWGIANVRRGG